MSTNQQEPVVFTIEDFNKSIAVLVKGQAKTAKSIGALLLQCLYFSIVEKDAGAANGLIACLRKSTKQAGIIALLETHGNLVWQKSLKTPRFAHFDADWEWTQEYVDGMREVCADWESYKPETEKETEFDVIKALESLQKKAVSAKSKSLNIKGEAALQAISLIVAKYNAAAIDKVL